MDDNPNYIFRDYNADKDISQSVRVGFDFKKYEVANGGNGIFGYGPSDRFVDADTMREWVKQFFEAK